MIVVALTNLHPITLRTVETKDKYEAYDLYSQNPNYIIAFINNNEVTILGSEAQKESKYQVLLEHGYIFEGQKVTYMCDNPL